MVWAEGSNHGLYNRSSIECRICSRSASRVDARHVLTTLNWDFFFCYNCETWYQASVSGPEYALAVRDRKLISSLNYFTQVLGAPNQLGNGAIGVLRRFRRWILGLYYRFISAYFE